ncbi:hypothetical protein [Desulfovermiculus halophilus]|jgi:hypothetical protein|uniref:hypothetical protein n=1 Tax=Desulfovermiculus halophilus TaxID=339722 RepID=UPI000481EE72|nr:hypothetical protein [Desulfovermiculus halophilus]
MSIKHILIVGVVIFILAGSGAGWFLFEQSAKLRSLNQDPGREYSGQVNEQLVTRAANGTSGNASLEGSGQTSDPDTQDAANATGAQEDRSWVEKSIIAPYLVQDVARLLVEHYRPANASGGGDTQGSLQISFKILNARYGIDFLNLHAPDKGVKQARSQVLQYALRPDVLERIYATYARDVLTTLEAEAEDAEKTVYGPDGQMKHISLTPEQIAEMHSLYAAYFRDVGRLMGVLSNNRALAEDIETYLQAEQDAVHASYLLKKARQEGNEGDQTAKERRTQAADAYRQALRHRERTKERILNRIQSRAPELDLPVDEIMYVAQWVHRRLMEGERSEALGTASALLQDFARRLQDRSRSVQAGA